jgi:hypothetical protein
MTNEEILRLKAEADTTQQTADSAMKIAATNPDDAAAKNAADEAIKLAVKAKEALEAAEKSVNSSYVPSKKTPMNKPSTSGVIALGIYLLLMVFFSVYLLGGLMMAETDEAKIKELKTEKGLNKPSSNTNNSNFQSNTNTNTNSDNTNIVVPQTPTSTPTPTPPPENNNGSTSPTKTPPNNSTKTPTPTPTPLASPLPIQNFVETSIPHEVYIRIPLLVDSPISADGFLFIMMFCAGMLGAVIRAVYSYFKHIGLQDFSFLWTWFYILVPFMGGALSLVIYLVIRGGFYGASFGKGVVLNLFSFAALGALTGLFTDNAMEKLKQIASTILADVPPKVENANDIVNKKESDKKNP